MESDLAKLVAAASAGDRQAWDSLVARFGALVWSVARSLGLSLADAADVSQATWLRLLERLDGIREPASIGAWLATTARREGLALMRARREIPLGAPQVGPEEADIAPQPPEIVLVEERNAALWRAFRSLPDRCQQLLRLLVLDPENDYASVSAALDVPVGSIGPTRGRCLDQMRRYLRTGAP